MLIREAIEKANTNQGIRRSNWNNICIVPTDTERCCLIFEDGKILSSRWNPKREDLIATDWTLA
ncbi:Thoeris anti-defense Tad2 family protein [Limosilactobacillus reuteri]|uniref:Thoeris anti-defense Tad2 family protein n=1 Tax=Limosilactobacillus reuteri TaxID=1598 RepID=UPI001094A234|nr:hypothetical protein [Limosilactobacillus reuteri]TGY56732.1 hypothetical protein E5337_09530 [Limosilactobacillus reuteri]